MPDATCSCPFCTERKRANNLSNFTHMKQLGLLSFYGFSLVWSPMFGTLEVLVFPSLAAYPDMLLGTRICNLIAFGIVMAMLSVAGERVKEMGGGKVLVIPTAALGAIGMLVGSLAGMGILAPWWLCMGAFARGLFYGMLTIYWIDVLIHLDNAVIGAAVSAALALYALVGVAIFMLATRVPMCAVAALIACPILSCAGCVGASRQVNMQTPVDQEGAKAPFRTRCLLYAANLAFSVIMGALLYFFARYDTIYSILAFLVAAVALFAIFNFSENRMEASAVYRALMMCFSIAAPCALFLGWLHIEAAMMIASAAVAFLILYIIVIFTDTQARMRSPYWKVPGMCQVFAALGMITGAVLFHHVYPQGEIDGAALVLLTAACIIFVAGVFSPSSRTRMRPWGFSSLIPAESPEAHALRRCGELAEECNLTSRELEILQQLAAGMTKDEIAEALVISPTTAKTHIRNIYAKLDVHSQRELAAKIDL